MNILVNGSSVSNGQGSWPYYIQQELGCNLINLSLAGAGNNYIADTTIAELSERSYDMVLIMWSEVNRIDFKVKTIPDVYYTSLAQSQLNEWPDKVPTPEVDYMQKDWVFSSAYLGKDTMPQIESLFQGYYNLSTTDEQLFNSVIKMISLQGVLKSLNMPYLFIPYKPLVGQSRFSQLFKMIDWDNVYTTQYLHSLAIENDLWNHQTDHPSSQTHKEFSKLLIQRIQHSS